MCERLTDVATGDLSGVVAVRFNACDGDLKVDVNNDGNGDGNVLGEMSDGVCLIGVVDARFNGVVVDVLTVAEEDGKTC